MTDRLVARTVNRLSRPLRWATFTAWGLALVATITDGTLGTGAAVIALGLIIAAPLVRVITLLVVWWIERDLRFVFTALLLLSIISLGAIVALIS